MGQRGERQSHSRAGESADKKMQVQNRLYHCKVTLTVFEYNSEMASYTPHGRTGLMSALLNDLTSAVIADGLNSIKVDQDILRKLDITPYHDDL